MVLDPQFYCAAKELPIRQVRNRNLYRIASTPEASLSGWHRDGVICSVWNSRTVRNRKRRGTELAGCCAVRTVLVRRHNGR